MVIGLFCIGLCDFVMLQIEWGSVDESKVFHVLLKLTKGIGINYMPWSIEWCIVIVTTEKKGSVTLEMQPSKVLLDPSSGAIL